MNDDRIQRTHDSNAEALPEQRSGPRHPHPVEALVAIEPLSTRVYGVCEISRSGMFLAFRDATSTREELEQGRVQRGARVEISFPVAPGPQHQQIRIEAGIVRIAEHGIAVQFETEDPPQLAPLRKLLGRARTQAAFAKGS